MSYNSETMSGPGSSLGDGDKTINVDQLAVVLTEAVMDFKIDLGVTKIGIGSLVPDGIETILVAMIAGEINKKAITYFDITETNRANTDVISYSICDKLWNKAWDFVRGQYPEKALEVAGKRASVVDALTDGELAMLFATVPGGIGYKYAVGDGARNPGRLTKYLSDVMEDVASEELGLELTDPTWNEQMDPGSTDTGSRDNDRMMEWGGSIQDAPHMKRWKELTSRLRKGEDVPIASKMPIMIIAAVGVAALILLKK